MATLNPSNVVNGNTIEASDIAQLYKAFGTGSGADITGLSMTGSITNADLATLSISASNITTAVTGSGTYYLTFVTGSGTKPPKIASLLEYNADTNNLTVTASFATTASFASNSSVTQVNAQSYDNSGIFAGDFKFVAGKVAMLNGAATSSAFPVLATKTLGINAWITANYSSGYGPTDVIAVTSISSSGAILFDNQQPGSPASAILVFTGIYI